MAALAKSKVRIAIVPHIFGLPVDLFERNGMDVIEDCAQALGASVGGKPVGLRGAVGIFSFYATKIITSGGQGGMLVSNERAIIDAVRDYRKFDCRNGRKPRFNFQMTDLQAAIGREQLRKLPSFVNRRREIFEQYRNAGIHLVDTHSEASPVRYRSVIRSKNPQWMINELAGCAIKTIIPVEEWELLGPVDKFPSAAEFARTTVSLPTYPSLSNEDLKYIIKSLHEIEDESLSWPVYEN
jgi:perosamine synthetase